MTLKLFFFLYLLDTHKHYRHQRSTAKLHVTQGNPAGEIRRALLVITLLFTHFSGRIVEVFYIGFSQKFACGGDSRPGGELLGSCKASAPEMLPLQM